MNITVGEKYLITNEDPLNIILKEKYQKKDKPFEYKMIGYFPKLGQVCSYILEREIKYSDGQSINELHELIIQTKKDILKAISESNGPKIK
jgi:hypothetical protein